MKKTVDGIESNKNEQNASEKTKKPKKRALMIVLIIIGVLLVILLGTVILFRKELKIVSSIKKVASDKPIYYMEFDNDYYFEEFLQSGGASSDKEVSMFLTEKISNGFYSVNVVEAGPACSVISARADDGSHLWGRNFDWKGSVPIIVKSVPKDGYASISTSDFKNMTGSSDTYPDNIANKMLAIAALYVPMDGMNEAGLCVADLEVNEGGMIEVDTEKSDLTITAAIRLVLNKAATVEEAITLLEQYDIHASGGISHHIALSDATGASVVLEFVDGGMISVPTNVVTNFNLAKGDTAAGGESAKERFEALSSLYAENNGVLTEQQVKDGLREVSQESGEWLTEWSIVYNQKELKADYWFDCDYDTTYSYSLGK